MATSRSTLALSLLALSCATASEPRPEPRPSTEPAPTEPAPTEPAPTEPAPPEPAPTEAEPTEPDPGPPFARTCPDLPAARPADLVVRFDLHDYRSPENLGRWALIVEGRACPPDELPAHLGYAGRRCVALGGAAYDALYAQLLEHHVDQIRTRPMAPYPHRGGSAIRLSWGGSERCRVAEIVNDTAVDPADREAYRAADGAIRTAVNRALGAP